MQSIMPLMMLMNGKGTAPGESQAMEQMLPMLLMMMDETEVTDDGEVVSINVCSESYLMSHTCFRKSVEMRWLCFI